MTIPAPYLLYLGHSDDEIGLKTSRGLAAFRGADCVGEWRHSDCPFTLGLPQMNADTARAAGARTLVLGIANPGGRFPGWMIGDALAAIRAGLNVACGLHERLRDVPELVEAAKAAGVQLFDVRDAPAGLPVGNGRRRAGNRLLTVGTDCSVGKMYETLGLRDALRARGVNMDVPISIGIVLALATSVIETINHAEHAYFDAAIMLVAFLLAGRYLDQNMRRRTRAFAGNLAALKAETATKFISPTEISTVPAAAIRPGDIVLLRPGERCAVDGNVIEGRSEVDQSLITGETLPSMVAPGSAVFAGTLIRSGTLRVRASAASGGTLLDEISRLLDRALQARSRYLRLAERASRLYAPVVHATALLTMLGWLAYGASFHDSIVTAIAVLIIT